MRGGGDAPSPPHDSLAVIDLPEDVPVLDLSAGPLAGVGAWWIGRYDEDRRGGYPQALFGGRRTLHVGLDLGAPAGTPVRAFADGVVEHAGVNPAAGDYGGVVVTRHVLPGGVRWVLWGHLAHADARRWRPGDPVARGEVLARLGAPAENGGWPPHLHVQLARTRPHTHDLPGVVDPAERDEALRRWPDPTDLLGLPPAARARLRG